MKKFRILVVDDSNRFRQLFKGALQASFPTIAIDEAADGSEALQKLDVFLPDLIFTGIRLIGGNGLELIKKIKALHPNIPVLILTNNGTPQYREAALYGADGFFAKASLTSMELAELVKSYEKV